MGGLFGTDWERREMERYLRRRERAGRLADGCRRVGVGEVV
jgi:hypothetical protein